VVTHAGVLDLTKLAQDLRAAGETAPKAIDRVLAESAQLILVEMKQLTPVKTGRLKASETIQASPGRYVVGPAGVPYAAYVEFGTRVWKGKPYVRPAVEKYLDKLGPDAADVGVSLITEGTNGQHS